VFNLFQKYKTITNIGSVLKMDLHAHWLPGIDDGAPDLDTSMKMLHEYVSLGYEKVIATPHVYQDYYPNSQQDIIQAFELVKKEAMQQKIPLKLDFAAEYYLDDHFNALLSNKELLTLWENYVLVEQSFIAENPDLNNIIFQMQIKGYQPILAHVERYGMYFEQSERIEEIRNLGVKLQINLGSLTGKYGPEIKKQAELLCKKGAVDFFATDAHKINDLKILNQFKIKNEQLLKNILV